MTELRADRPARLVTVCLYLGLLAAVQIVQVFTVLSSWDSTSGQKQVKKFTDPLVEEGFSRDGAETTYRILLGVLAILAASAVVFAVYTTMGHAVSRIMLTITAPLMALVGLGEGSVFAIALSIVTFYCVSQLWSPEVRRWFARLAGKDVSMPGPPPAQPVPTEVASQPSTSLPVQVAPVRQPAPTDWVKIMSIITLIVSSLVALGCGLFLVVYGVARDQFVRMEVDSSGNWANLTEAEVRDAAHTFAVMSWALLPLCLIAIGVSITLLVRRRQRR